MRVQSIHLPAASGPIITGSGYITYWSVLDTTVSSGSIFSIIDGNATDGQGLIKVATIAGQSTSEYIHRLHLCYKQSLYFKLTSGTIDGDITVHACDSNEELEKLVTALTSLQQIAGGSA